MAGRSIPGMADLQRSLRARMPLFQPWIRTCTQLNLVLRALESAQRTWCRSSVIIDLMITVLRR